MYYVNIATLNLRLGWGRGEGVVVASDGHPPGSTNGSW